jgi:hypothetical protein
MHGKMCSLSLGTKSWKEGVNDVSNSKEHPYFDSGIAFVFLEKLTNPQRVVL